MKTLKAFCRACDYSLEGLEIHRCPECGIAFDPRDGKTFSQRPSRRTLRFLRRFWPIIVLGGLILGYVAIAVTVPCGFGYTSYCTECGMKQTTDDRHVPLFGMTFNTQRVQSPTVLSALLTRRGIRLGHTHNWSFAQGGDYGFRWSCALGNGRALADVVNSPSVAIFVDGLCAYADPQTRDRWLNILLDPLKNRHIAIAIELRNPPVGGFPDAATFHTWLDLNAEEITKTLDLFNVE